VLPPLHRGVVLLERCATTTLTSYNSAQLALVPGTKTWKLAPR